MGIRIFLPSKYLTIAVLSYYSWKLNFQEVSSMTDEQKQQIIALRRDGAGYGRIAARRYARESNVADRLK